MTLYDLGRKIADGELDRLYVFFGPEIEVQRKYIKAISQRTGKAIVYVDTVAEVIKRLSKKTLTDASFTFVVLNDTDIFSEEGIIEKLRAYLTSNVMVLQYDTLDKRSSFYKKSDAVEFECMSKEVLRQYVEQEVPLSQECADKLISLCTCNYRRILFETDKIRNFAKAYRTENYDKVFRTLLKDGCIHQGASDRIFELISMVVARNPEGHALLNQLKQQGEAPLKVIALLYTEFRSILALLGTDMGKGVSERSGVPAWKIGQLKDKLQYWTPRTVERRLHVLQDCEYGIKTGTYDAPFAVDYAMCEIYRKDDEEDS